MKAKTYPVLLSVVVPVYNEQAGLASFHKSLMEVVHGVAADSYEILYCDDGSTDGSAQLVRDWHEHDSRVKLLALSRNFGKEVTTSAGLSVARAEAIIMLDADGQHPVELIPQFVDRWRAGSKVVIGVRIDNQQEGFIKRHGSKWFYRLFNRFTGIKLIPGASDFRLIDASVQQEFMRLTERNRITRGLIDWLGFPRDYIEFKANPRLEGEPGYSVRKLMKLAIDSIVSLSLMPLYVTAYLGAIVLPVSLLLGLFMVINALLSDPLNLHITGGAYVMVFLLFLIGILLVSQGIIGLYMSHIHTETQNRPLFIVDNQKSTGVE